MTLIPIILRMCHAVVVALSLNCGDITVMSDRKQKKNDHQPPTMYLKHNYDRIYVKENFKRT